MAKTSELWDLVWGKPQVDPDALMRAIEHELGADTQDFRTRVLIRDSTAALESYWGPDRLQEEPSLKQAAVRNWYVLFGEDLPE